jgi:hypothetical protein
VTYKLKPGAEAFAAGGHGSQADVALAYHLIEFAEPASAP